MPEVYQEYVAANAGSGTTPSAQAQRLLSKLNRGAEDASMLYIGDSTGNEPWQHVYLEFAALAAQSPE